MKLPTLATLAALLLLCTPGSAQLSRYKADFSISSTNFADTISVQWNQGRVVVPVSIAGTTFHFLLDTGAGQAVVYDDSPFMKDCQGAGAIISHDATGASDTVRMVTLPPIVLGQNTLTGCQATIQHRPVASRLVDGILGFDLVCRGLNLKIDAAASRLILSDRKDFFDAEPGHDVHYKLNFHVPYLQVCPFGKYTEDVLFDTGSPLFYAISKSSFDRGEKKAAAQLAGQVEGRSLGRHAIGHQGAEARGEVVFLGLRQLKVGTLTFTDVHTLTTQGGSHLGAAVLQQCAVVFNPRRKCMRLQPYSGSNTIAIANRQTEIAFVDEGGMPVVSLVWQQGEPYRQGLREGDTIVRIDGKPVRSFAQFTSWGFEQGRPYTFIVRDRRGFQKEVEWVRRP